MSAQKNKQDNTPPRIGVLALQGAVQAHHPHIEAGGAVFCPVKTPQDFQSVDAFILPGGESTTMLKLIDVFDLKEPLAKAFAQKPVWGICAGAILIARTVSNPSQFSFDLLPIHIRRNAYGAQKESVFCDVAGIDAPFIRAPIIERTDPSVCILAKRGDDPVWVRYHTYMATTFHPELSKTTPSPMHQFFVDEIVKPSLTKGH